MELDWISIVITGIIFHYYKSKILSYVMVDIVFNRRNNINIIFAIGLSNKKSCLQIGAETMKENMENRKKYIGLAIMFLMVLSVGMPLLHTVDSSNISYDLSCIIPYEPDAVISTAQTGTWNAGATWVGGTPPGTGDDAIILNTHTVTLPIGGIITGSCEIQAGGTLAGASYTLTCDDENGAGFSFDNDGTISGVLDITFTYNALSQVDFVGTAGNPVDVVVNSEGQTVQQTTATTMTTLTVTVGVWDSNDEALTVSSTFNIDDTFDAGSSLVNIGGDADFTGGTLTDVYSNFTFDGTTEQTITMVANAFYNLTISNAHISASVIIVDDLDVNGNLTITNGQIDFDTNNPDIETDWNVTISDGAVITHGTGNWSFDVSTNYTDNSGTQQNIGNVTVGGYLYLLSNCSIENISVTGDLVMTTYFLNVSGNIFNTSTGDITPGTSTVRFINSATLNLSYEHLYNLTLDDSVTLTIINDAYIYVDNELRIDGTTGGGFIGTAIIRLAYQKSLTSQILYCGANADFGDTVIYINADGNTIMDGCANYNNIQIRRHNTKLIVTLANRSITCVDFLFEGSTVQPAVFETSTYDLKSTGTFTLGRAGATFTYFNSGGNLYLTDVTTISGVGLGFNSTSNTSVTGDCDLQYITSLNLENTTFNGTAQQTVTMGTNGFNNLTINNTHASASVIIVDDLDVDGNFTLIDGQVDFDTNNPDINTEWNVTITDGVAISPGTGTWVFDGTTYYADNSGTTQDIGDTSVTGTLNLNTNCSIVDMTVTGTTVMTTYYLNATGNIDVSGGALTEGTGYVNCIGTVQQTITQGANDFYNMIVNNTHATQEVIFAGTQLNVTGILTFIDGQIDFDTNNPFINTTGNVTISAITSISHGSNPWSFIGTTYFTDSHTTAQNIGDISVPGTLYLLSDCHTENITVNETGTLDLTANEILTINGNVTFNTTTTFNRGSTIWFLNGTINQTITASEHQLHELYVYNTGGNITFVNDTNISWLRMFANTSLILSDNMTVSRLYLTGVTGGRISVSSNNSSVTRYFFNPIAHRNVANTDFTTVTLIPVEIENVGGTNVWPFTEPTIVDEEEPEPEDEGFWKRNCGIGVIVLGICMGGGALAILKDPRRKEEESFQSEE